MQGSTDTSTVHSQGAPSPPGAGSLPRRPARMTSSAQLRLLSDLKVGGSARVLSPAPPLPPSSVGPEPCFTCLTNPCPAPFVILQAIKVCGCGCALCTRQLREGALGQPLMLCLQRSALLATLLCGFPAPLAPCAARLLPGAARYFPACVGAAGRTTRGVLGIAAVR